MSYRILYGVCMSINIKTYVNLNNPRISSLFVSLLIVLLVSMSCFPLMTYAGGSSFEDVVSVDNEVTRGMSGDFVLRSDIELDESLVIPANKPAMLMSYGQGEFSRLAVASDIYADESSFEDVVSVGNEVELRVVIGNATRDMPVNIALSCDIELDESLVIPADKHIVLMSCGMAEFFRLIGASGADTILVESGGVLELAGIIVTHPSATYGRGVTVFPGGVLTMYSGEIFGNKGTLDGGGVCNYGDFTMYGGVIYGNIARYGGGVLNVEGIFTLSGGTIFDNHASYSGGGLYSEAGDFTMTGGMILGNSAVGHGGGVFLFSSSSSLFDGGISGNTATSGDGGGVYNFQGTFTMFGGMVNGNTARYGGGVLNDRGIFTLSGGAISDNSVLYSGGGVFSDFGEFTMSGGMISHNTAGAGGGVFLSSVSSSLLDGVISDNTAVWGGGIAASTSVFGMYGGVISDNTAFLGGGIYTRLGNFGMLGGVISNNVATEDGGGIYLESGFTDLLDGMVLENTATNNGGGVGLVHENLDKLWVYDGMVFSDNSASSAYDRAPEHDDIYHTQIGANVIWTSPFVQGYNNYDISYTYTPSILSYYVTVINSYAQTSGAGYYFEDDFVVIDAGTQPGYIFAGWTVNEGDISLSNDYSTWFIMPASSVVVTANWELLAVYSIDYVLNGGSNPFNNPLVYTAADLPLSIADPFKADCTFLGWIVTYDGGVSVVVDGSFSIPLGATGDLVLTANWDDEISAVYDIVYVLDGGINAEDNPSTYTAADLPVTIVNPTKVGFVFAGWTIVFFDNSQSDITMPTVSYVLAEGTTGDIGLTAVWEPIIDETPIADYNRVYAQFSSYYDAETGQFCVDLFDGYTVESVLEAERIMNAAAQVHTYLLVLYGRLDVGHFTAADSTSILEVSTRVLMQAIEDMNKALKLDVPSLFADVYDRGNSIRVWFSYPVEIDNISAMADGEPIEFGDGLLSGTKAWVPGVGYLNAYSYIDVAKTDSWQMVVLTLRANDQVLVLELENDLYNLSVVTVDLSTAP